MGVEGLSQAWDAGVARLLECVRLPFIRKAWLLTAEIGSETHADVPVWLLIGTQCRYVLFFAIASDAR